MANVIGSLLEEEDINEDKLKYPVTVREAIKMTKKYPKIMNEILGDELSKQYIDNLMHSQEVYFYLTR